MTILNSLTTSVRQRPARFAVYATATVGVIVAVVLIYVLVIKGDSSSAATSLNEVEFAVERGTITTAVSIGGTSYFPEKSDLTFGGNGMIAEVMVSEGETVSEGDVIARLSDATVANLLVAEAAAETALSKAQAAYTNAVSGSSHKSDVATAEAALSAAEFEVTSARRAVLKATSGDSTESEAAAEARVELRLAEISLDKARQDLANAEESSQLADVTDALDEAVSDYETVLKRWFGAVPDGFETMSLDEIMAFWDTTFKDVYTTQAALQNQRAQPFVDNPATPWDDVVVWLWTYMSLNSIDTDNLNSSKASVLTPLGEIDDAWTALEVAQDAYDEGVAGAEQPVLTAQKAVSTAQDAVETAQEHLDEVLSVSYLGSKQSALDAAEAKRDEAQIALEQAQDSADSLVKDAEAKLTLAQQALDDASDAVANAELVSPINGSVLAVNVEAGDQVTATTVVAQIADTSVIAVESDVDEEDILSIQVGLPVSVSLDAVAGQTFTGVITSIGQASQSQQGAVSFPVVVTLDGTGGLQLVEGLTASAQVINSQVSDVLMVPVAAVGGTLFEPTVDRVTDRGTEAVTVELGTSNGTYVQIVNGLDEGDTVVARIAGDVGLSTGNGQGGGGTFTIPGGDFGGGGVIVVPDGGGNGTFRGRGNFGGGGN